MANISDNVPNWLMITIFLIIVFVLIVFTDMFTAIVGTLVMIGIFASGYNESHNESH